MNVVMHEAEILKAINKIANDVQRDLTDLSKLVIVGIHTGGVHLARRLQQVLQSSTGMTLSCGTLDITLYRDDLFEGLTKPIIGATHLPESIEGREVLLVDDVLYTGRTVRAALFELMDYGRPTRIRLAVLIDRGHRELPIIADYVGRRVDTARTDNVHVNLRESTDGPDEVVILRGKP